MMKEATLEGPSGARVVLAGGILGLAEDGPKLAAWLERERFTGILLGIPFEDLDAIGATIGEEAKREFEQDATDDAYLKALAKFGPVQVPPPDLYAAFAYARAHSLAVEAIDLGDEGHSNVWAESVGFFELMRNNRRLRRIPEETLVAADPEAFAREWDEKLFPTKGLQKVQRARESWMARRIQEHAQGSGRWFALVPLARWNGVRAALESEQKFGRIA